MSSQKAKERSVSQKRSFSNRDSELLGKQDKQLQASFANNEEIDASSRKRLKMNWPLRESPAPSIAHNKRAEQRRPAKSAARTAADTIVQPGKTPSRVDSQELARPVVTGNQSATVHDAGDRKRDSGRFRFGKALANAFNNRSTWQGTSNARKENPETQEAEEKDTAVSPLAGAEQPRIGKRRSSFFENLKPNKYRSSADLSAIARMNDSGVGLEKDQSSTKRDVSSSTADPSTFPFTPTLGGLQDQEPVRASHRRRNSLQSLKRAASQFSLTRGVISPEPNISAEAEFDEFGLQKASKKDLQKKQKLQKRISNLEVELERAKRELADNGTEDGAYVTMVGKMLSEDLPTTATRHGGRVTVNGTPIKQYLESDIPAFSSRKRSTDIGGSHRSSLQSTNAHLPPAKRFVPGALPSLPSERILLKRSKSAMEDSGGSSSAPGENLDVTAQAVECALNLEKTSKSLHPALRPSDSRRNSFRMDAAQQDDIRSSGRIHTEIPGQSITTQTPSRSLKNKRSSEVSGANAFGGEKKSSSLRPNKRKNQSAVDDENDKIEEAENEESNTVGIAPPRKRASRFKSAIPEEPFDASQADPGLSQQTPRYASMTARRTSAQSMGRGYRSLEHLGATFASQDKEGAADDQFPKLDWSKRPVFDDVSRPPTRGKRFPSPSPATTPSKDHSQKPSKVAPTPQPRRSSRNATAQAITVTPGGTLKEGVPPVPPVPEGIAGKPARINRAFASTESLRRRSRRISKQAAVEGKEEEWKGWDEDVF